MTNFIPIFPLSLIVYPGEKLNLHIFESRYKQLIAECFEQKKPFGIPAVVDNELKELGTLVEISSLEKIYDDGTMDISTRGVKVFRTLEVVKDIPEKLYSGAIVTYPGDATDGNSAAMEKLLSRIRQLHQLLKISKDFKKADQELTVFDVAHHIGLSPAEEYELLGLFREAQRQEYLNRHLEKAIAVLLQMENLKEKVKLNGHFKNLQSFNFDL